MVRPRIWLGDTAARWDRVWALSYAVCSRPGAVPAGIYRLVLPECQALPWFDPCTQPRQTLTSTGGQVCALTLPDGLCVGSLACVSCQGLAFVLVGRHAPTLGKGQWGGRNCVLSGPAEPRGERVHGWPLTNKHEAHAGRQPVPVLSLPGEDGTGVQAARSCSCFPPAWAGPLCTPCPPPRGLAPAGIRYGLCLSAWLLPFRG